MRRISRVGRYCMAALVAALAFASSAASAQGVVGPPALEVRSTIGFDAASSDRHRRLLKAAERRLEDEFKNSATIRFVPINRVSKSASTAADSASVHVSAYIVNEPASVVPASFRWSITGPAQCGKAAPPINGAVPLGSVDGSPGDAANLAGTLIEKLEAIVQDVDRRCLVHRR